MRYPFCCTRCGLEFEVSQPVREASQMASCPADGAEAQRIFTVPTMNFNRPPSATPELPPSGFWHSGHSHGPGTAHHSH